MPRHARVQQPTARSWGVSPALVGTVAAAVTTAGVASAGVSHHVVPTAAKARDGVSQARAITAADRHHHKGSVRASHDNQANLADLDAERAAERVARGEARRLLEERVAELEHQATLAAARVRARAAAAAREHFLWLQRSCGYHPVEQRHPDHNAGQLRNARTIIRVAREMHLPARAAVIAIAAAEQESKLNNMRGGDLDSAGLFQMRPSAGWGSYRQVTDPEYASRKFYRVLLEVSGWQHLPVTVAAQSVEISGYPWAYARWELSAHQLVSKAWPGPDTQLLCVPTRTAARAEQHRTQHHATHHHATQHHKAAHHRATEHHAKAEHHKAEPHKAKHHAKPEHHQAEHHQTTHHKAEHHQTTHHAKPRHHKAEHHKAEHHKAPAKHKAAKHARSHAKPAQHRHGKHAR
jgi:hypothetical protein